MIETLPAFWAVIPAAGIGARMAADRPKQYLELAGQTILEHSLDCFLGHPMLKGVVVSIAEDDPYWPGLRCASDPRIQRAAGGRERADSVLNALLMLHAQGAADSDWVLVHDAARPNLARSDLDKLLSDLADDPVAGNRRVVRNRVVRPGTAAGRRAQRQYQGDPAGRPGVVAPALGRAPLNFSFQCRPFRG